MSCFKVRLLQYYSLVLEALSFVASFLNAARSLDFTAWSNSWSLAMTCSVYLTLDVTKHFTRSEWNSCIWRPEAWHASQDSSTHHQFGEKLAISQLNAKTFPQFMTRTADNGGGIPEEHRNLNQTITYALLAKV